MKRTLIAALVAALGCLPLGCGERFTTTREKKIETPGGTTTITTETEVKKTGDHPPPAQP